MATTILFKRNASNYANKAAAQAALDLYSFAEGAPVLFKYTIDGTHVGGLFAIGTGVGPGSGNYELLSTDNDLTQASLYTILGASIVGQAIVKKANPGVVSFLRVNANDTVDYLTPADTVTALSLLPIETTLTNSTDKIPRSDAVYAAINNLLASNDAMVFKGTLGTGGTITALPTTYNAGWTYRIITAGIYANQVTQAGDMIIAMVDRAGSGNLDADWTVIQTNIDGAVITTGGTINELAYWTGANSLGTLAVTTYPSLTEISYVKGLTSAIQTQLNNKAPIATPTFTTNITTPLVNLSASSNQLVFQSGGVTGTLTWTPATANKIITFPNRTLTVDNITTATTSDGTGFLKAVGGVIAFDNSIYLTSVTAHDLLSATHGDTTASAVARGSIITGQGVTPKWAGLAFPATPTGKVIVASSTDVEWSSSPLGTAAWAATGDFSASNHNHTLDSLSNVSITSKATGDLTQWNGTNWINIHGIDGGTF